VSIRPVELADADRIAEIYCYSVQETSMTFGVDVPSFPAKPHNWSMDARPNGCNNSGNEVGEIGIIDLHV
jgi:hypothetical protein